MIDIGIQKMKNYLAQAIECEKNVYIWSESMKKTNNEMKQIYADQEKANAELEAVRDRIDNLSEAYRNKEQAKHKETARYSNASKKHKRRCALMVLLMPVVALLWAAVSFLIFTTSEAKIETALICIYLLAFLEAAPIILFIISKRKIKKYANKSTEIKGTNLVAVRENEESELTKEKERLTERCAWLIVAEQCITDWQDDIHKSYKQALETRKKLYSLNIIDPQFQNFFCATMFYDYIQTGRVVSVNGPYGLASTLHNDRRDWEVVSRLNDLCAIAEYATDQQQYMIRQIEEANNVRNKISDQLSSLNTSVDSLAEQQARTADAASRIETQLRYGY